MTDKRFIYTRDFPRVPLPPDAEGPVGLPEMAKLSGHTEAAVYKWFEYRKLPLADGPMVWGKVTWQRSTFLAWAHHHGFTVDKRGVACGEHEEAAHWAGIIPAEQVPKAANQD